MSTADVDWLDPGEMRYFRAFLEASQRVLGNLDHALKDHSDMTLDDYEVLVHLSEAHDRRLRMSELSDKLLHSQSRLTQRIDRMVVRGFVCREKCEDDRRGTYACLTEEGLRTLEDAAPRHLDDVRRWLVDVLGADEQTQLTDLLERIAANAR